jgi:hypothetical protein
MNPPEEEPFARMKAAIVVAQFVDQPVGKDRVAILAAFSLLDADQAALRFDMSRSKRHRLAHAQSRAVDAHQQCTVLGVVRRREQCGNLFLRIDNRPACHLAPSRHTQFGPRTAQHLFIQKPECSQRLIDRTPCKLLFLNQMKQKGLNLFGLQRSRRAVVMQTQPDQPANVGVNGSLGIMSDPQGIDGAFTQSRAHGLLLSIPTFLMKIFVVREAYSLCDQMMRQPDAKRLSSTLCITGKFSIYAPYGVDEFSMYACIEW